MKEFEVWESSPHGHAVDTLAKAGKADDAAADDSAASDSEDDEPDAGAPTANTNKVEE